MSRRHFLSGNPCWYFAQHVVGIRAPIHVIPDDTKKRKTKRAISGESSCREGLVHGVRRCLQRAMTRSSRSTGPYSWDRRCELVSKADLTADVLKQPGEAYLYVANGHVINNLARPHPKAGEKRPRPKYWPGRWNSRYPKTQHYRGRMSQSKVRDFLDFCDAIIGPVAVLMNPDRFEGNWWETTVQEATESRKGYMRWYGIDNTAIAHPALASLFTGLARQCAYLVRCDIKDLVLGDLDEAELEECLTNADPELALRLTKKMKRWIEVPAPRCASTANIPVPIGSFSKIPALHRAIYKHGFKKTFGRSFESGWAIRSGPYAYYGTVQGEPRYSGIHTFMGQKASSAAGKRIKELAKKRAA